MSNQNKKGVTIVQFNGMNDVQDSVHYGTALVHPFVASENTAVHSNGLKRADGIYSKANNDVKLPTTIKPDTLRNTEKNDNFHSGTAFIHPFVQSNGLNPANVVYSEANNADKLPMTIKPDTAENTDTNASPDSKIAPAPNTDPWSLKKIAVTFAMGTSAHGFANSNRLWIAGYKNCSRALLCMAIFMPMTSFLFGFIGMRDQLAPNYRATSITVVNDKQTGLALPKILIANSAIFNYTALKHYNVSQYEASLITTLLVGKFAYTDILERNIDKVNKDYHNLLHRLNTSAYDVWNLLSYKCHEIITECLYNIKHIPGPICCEKHFSTVLGSSGLSFLSTTTFIQESEEVASGLTLGLRVPDQVLDLDWDYINQDATILKKGLRVSIIENSRDFSAVSSSVVAVNGLDRILATLSYTQHDNTGLYQNMLPWLDPTADCTPSDAPYQELATIKGNCVVSSLHVCAHRLRNCSFVSYPFRKGTERFCHFEDQQAMIHSDEAAKCRADHVAKCGHLCKEDVYSFSAQSSPLMQFSDMPEKEMNSTWAVGGAFTMHYTHLGHTIFAQSKAHLVTLLSSLGGTMNTFMGFSFTVAGEMCTTLSAMLLFIVITNLKKCSSRGGNGAQRLESNLQ